MPFGELAYPLKQLPDDAVAVTFDQKPHGPSTNPRDEAEIARFGKIQRLRRNFGLLSIVGLTCTLMITWEGSLTVFQSGLTNGGPAGLIYGFIFTWIGTGLQALVMAELASMIPLAGGQYNWVALLAPKSCSKFLSYLTGWITVISWQAALASAAFLAGTMIQGLLVLNYDGYNLQRWHGTLLFYAVILLSLFINTYLARLLPKIEGTVLIIHVVGFFCVLIPLVYLAPHGTAKDVFANFNNGGGWSTDGLAFFVGLSTSMFSFIGVDAATHMAEEIEDASTVIPRSMLASVALNGSLGFAMVTATLFCLGDEEKAINSPTGFPFIEVFVNATGSNAGANAMISIIITAMIFAAVGLLATASRMLWAFAREQGLPGSSLLAKVEPRTLLPLYSIGMTAIISLVLALINIGSTKAFNALTSLVIASFYSSFSIAAAVLLYRKLTSTGSDLVYGSFYLGRAGIPILILSLAYSAIGFFFSFWPPTSTVDAVSMNWSVAVYGGAILFSLLFWVLHGRKVYTGPRWEVSPDEPVHRDSHSP
ncbi:hypothetical protein XANCAGTX0491_001296 [Xanthoria calcicola]